MQPVLDAVAERAAHLCEAPFATVWLAKGDFLHTGAAYSLDGTQRTPAALPLKRSTVSGRAILDRVAIHYQDLDPLLESEYPDAINARPQGMRAVLGVPLMREDKAYGSIFLFRSEPRPFSPDQIALVETFARQAAIATDNTRLFNETKESLEQQTATSEILRVISRSPTDVQPVFDTIAAAALKLCRATSAVVAMVDGDFVRLAASANISEETAQTVHRRYPRKRGRDTATVRAIETRAVVTIPDVLADPEYDVANAVKEFRCALGVPLLRDGEPMGAIGIGRAEIGDYSEKEIALLRTFADQAVIAIENVRLFNETKEALDQQTATAQILQAISSSPGDLQPVLDAVVRAAAQFCSAPDVLIMRLDKGVLRGAAAVGPFADVLTRGAGSLEAIEIPLTRGSVSGRSVVECRTIHVHDIVAEHEEYPEARKLQRLFGHHTMAATPLLREGAPLGAIVLFRTEVEPFSGKQLSLLKTFADQAVIAIENVRLFKELEVRTAELMQSVGELKALGEVSQTVSSTLDLETVLNTIVSQATQLAGVDGGTIWEYDETREEFHLRASDGLPDELVNALRIAPIPKGEGAIGRLAVTGEPVEIRDIVDPSGYQSRVREISIRLGYQSLLGVPLLREDHVLGGLVVIRSRQASLRRR